MGKIPAQVPMPNNWAEIASRDLLDLPEGLTSEMLDQAAPLLRAFREYGEFDTDPVAALLFRIFRG